MNGKAQGGGANARSGILDADAIANGLMILVGVLSVANGIWMLVSPSGWFTGVPAGAPDFGPYNVHFVRDFGGAFVAIGAAVCWASQTAGPVRTALLSIALLFFGVHALIHVFDTARGAVDLHHLWLDFPGAYLPALVVGTLIMRRNR